MAVKLSILFAGRPLPPRNLPSIHFCSRPRVEPRAIVRLEGLGTLNKSNDLIGTRNTRSSGYAADRMKTRKLISE
jgi:hypothetical protein